MFIASDFDNNIYTVFDTEDEHNTHVTKQQLDAIRDIGVKVGIYDGNNIILPNDYIDSLFHKFVPHTGKADKLLGEIVSALSRIVYRYYNDGDRIGVYYGRNTCNPAFRFLIAKVPLPSRYKNYHEDLSDFFDSSDVEYELFLKNLSCHICAYIFENYDKLLSTKNDKGYNSYADNRYDNESYDDDMDEDDDWDEDDD